MIAQDLYKETLLDHYRHPRNRCDGPIHGADAVERGANPRCGDEVEIGIFLKDKRIEDIQFRGRGCAICIASASMMTDAVIGLNVANTQLLCEKMRAWFGEVDTASDPVLPDTLQALAAVRKHPARQKCVLLSWEALDDAIAGATKG
jgi:nitrogen fixation NifU-like protein